MQTAHLAVLQAHDLLDQADLRVVRDLLRARVAHVQQLAAQREHTVLVAANNAEPAHLETAKTQVWLRTVTSSTQITGNSGKSPVEQRKSED